MIAADLVLRARDADLLATTERLGARLKRVTATELAGRCPACGGAWAAGSAGRMPALADAVSGYVNCITGFGHRDEAGEHGARELAARLGGRRVKTIRKFLDRPASPPSPSIGAACCASTQSKTAQQEKRRI